MLCILLSLLGSGTWTVYAQTQGGVNLKARAGFDGFCKRGEWLPVHVEVENTGSDLNAEVQVSHKKNAGGTSITSMKIDLPATSHKEFFLYTYFPEAYNRQLTVTLLSGKKVLKKIDLNVNCPDPETMIFGVLADDPSAYDVLNDVKPLNGFIRVAQLKTSDLPDRAQAWGSLDALIISNVDTGTFTPEQKQALKSWIVAGGKVLVIGGINWQSTVAGLKEIMPVDLNTTSHVASLSQLQAYVKDPTPLDKEAVLAQGQVRAGAQILLRQDGIPLLVQETMGFGMICYLAADPALQPLSNWEGMKDVYEHLLGAKSQAPMWIEGPWQDYRANQALATIPELGLPSIFYICGLLGVYIAVIGPLNFFILRRMKRRELAWVTIPVLVVIFTCLAYGTGFSYRGMTPVLNRLAVVQAWDGVEQAQVHALIGVYSPIRTKYDLETKEQFMPEPFGENNTNFQANNDLIVSQQGSSMIMPDVSLEIGDMKTLAVEGNLPALKFSHNLVFTFSKLNPVLTGDITNKSQVTLKDAILVTPGDWERLGDIKPGQKKSINISLVNQMGPSFYTLNSQDILNVSYIDLQNDETTIRRNAFLDTVLYQTYGVNRGNWGVYLMGWVDQVEIPAGLKDQHFKAIDTMLYVDRLSPTIKIEPGEYHVPANLFAWESSDQNMSPYSAYGVPARGYTLRFQPVVPISPGTVKSIDLYLTSTNSSQNLKVSAWDYENKTWITIPLTGSYTSIPEANRYVGPDGEIKIEVRNNQSDITQITASNVSVVVEP